MAKFANKCACCGRCADTKWRGQYFCNDHRKWARRYKVRAFYGKDHIVGAFPPTPNFPISLPIYREYIVKLC